MKNWNISSAADLTNYKVTALLQTKNSVLTYWTCRVYSSAHLSEIYHHCIQVLAGATVLADIYFRTPSKLTNYTGSSFSRTKLISGSYQGPENPGLSRMRENSLMGWLKTQADMDSPCNNALFITWPPSSFYFHR